MSQHYKVLYDQSKEIENGSLVYRVELTRDCVHGSIGDRGGWVADQNSIQDDAWVFGEAMIYEAGQLFDSAVVSGDAKVRGSASIRENSIVSEQAVVYGNAEIRGKAQVKGTCEVYGHAQVYGDTILKDDCVIWGKARVESGEWIESPFQAIGMNDHFVTEIKPGYLHIGCETKSFEKWITEGATFAKKKSSQNLYKKYAGYIEPLIRKYLKYSKDNWSELGLIQKATYHVVLLKAKGWLKEQGREDDSEQYKVKE